jgi:hypothetical protein
MKRAEMRELKEAIQDLGRTLMERPPSEGDHRVKVLNRMKQILTETRRHEVPGTIPLSKKPASGCPGPDGGDAALSDGA